MTGFISFQGNFLHVNFKKLSYLPLVPHNFASHVKKITTSAVAKDPENMYSDVTAAVSMKCLTSETNLEITIEWYYGDQQVPADDVTLSQSKIYF